MGMHTWFECKIRYEKVMENGMQKKVTEPYLVDAFLEEVEEIVEDSYELDEFEQRIIR